MSTKKDDSNLRILQTEITKEDFMNGSSQKQA
jgi:hypothetical protein